MNIRKKNEQQSIMCKEPSAGSEYVMAIIVKHEDSKHYVLIRWETGLYRLFMHLALSFASWIFNKQNKSLSEENTN